MALMSALLPKPATRGRQSGLARSGQPRRAEGESGSGAQCQPDGHSSSAGRRLRTCCPSERVGRRRRACRRMGRPERAQRGQPLAARPASGAVDGAPVARSVRPSAQVVACASRRLARRPPHPGRAQSPSNASPVKRQLSPFCRAQVQHKPRDPIGTTVKWMRANDTELAFDTNHLALITEDEHKFSCLGQNQASQHANYHPPEQQGLIPAQRHANR